MIKRELPTLLLVTLVSALIWLYAENRDVRESQMIPLAVVLPEQTSSDLAVHFAGNPPGVMDRRLNVRATLRGATGQRGRLEGRLSADPRVVINLPRFNPEILEQGGEVPINLSESLATVPPFAGSGVSIVRVEPTVATLEVQPLVRREVPVVFEPAGIELGSEVTIEPSRVTVVLPRDAMQSLLTSEDVFFAEAHIPAGTLNQLTRGIAHTMSAQLRLPDALQRPHVRLERERVQVTFTITRVERSVTIPFVPVWVVAPPGELERFQILISDDSQSISDVTVTGPSEWIERIESGELTVVARVVLRLDDTVAATAATEQKPRTQPVSFDLLERNPEAGTSRIIATPDVLRIEAPTRQATYRVIRR